MPIQKAYINALTLDAWSTYYLSYISFRYHSSGCSLLSDPTGTVYLIGRLLFGLVGAFPILYRLFVRLVLALGALYVIGFGFEMILDESKL